jgi:hypothetical protein
MSFQVPLNLRFTAVSDKPSSIVALNIALIVSVWLSHDVSTTVDYLSTVRYAPQEWTYLMFRSDHCLLCNSVYCSGDRYVLCICISTVSVLKMCQVWNIGSRPVDGYSSHPQQTSVLRFASASTSHPPSDVNTLELNDLHSGRDVKEHQEIRPLKPVNSDWIVGDGDMKLSLPPLNVSLA